MRKLATAALLGALLSLLPCTLKAQTYTLPFTVVNGEPVETPFNHCSLESVYPIQSFYQFQCNMPMADKTGAVVGSFFWRQDGIVEVYLPGGTEVTSGEYFNNSLAKISFSDPANGQPGTFSFSWQELNPDGTWSTGIASGTWVDGISCGGRGCLWHYPKILTFQTTVNKPVPVARREKKQHNKAS